VCCVPVPVKPADSREQWLLQQYKIWKGLDPEKMQWANIGIVCSEYGTAQDVIDLLEANSPERVFRIKRELLPQR
jgi:hypothetical protein